MRRFVLALALVAACSSSPKGGGDGGAGSGGVGGGQDLAPAGPLDMTPRSTAGIACGATACTDSQQLCCTGDNGITGTCQMVSNPSCASSEFQCDGPEDCPLLDHECCVEAGLAACRTPGYCQNRATMVPAYLMCHSVADCPSGYTCSGAPNGSPYALCIHP